MRKLASIIIIFLLAIGFVVAGNTRVEAMNNESAAMLAGAIALFGKPVLNAIARDIVYPDQGYAYAYPSRHMYAYPQTRYIEKTKIIYAPPIHKRLHRHNHQAYERGYHDEWCRLEYHRGQEDARRNYPDYDDDD